MMESWNDFTTSLIRNSVVTMFLNIRSLENKTHIKKIVFYLESIIKTIKYLYSTNYKIDY